jgi:undecaprenyl phosphate-alpha-L-ara4FN deformylase
MHTATAERCTPSRRIALKVDVDTLRGTQRGVPRLAELLARYDAGATFLFSLYGTLLPGPDIGKRCADTLRAVRDAGFEVGIHSWDHVKWQAGVCAAGADWTEREMRIAVARFEEIFGAAPRVHAAAGWQMNVHSYRLTQRLGFDYCSDTRGCCPYIPIIDAEIVACPQIPTTLPTFDELVGRDGVDASNAAERLVRVANETHAPAGHVFSLHAELEGIKLLAEFEKLLAAWKSAGIELLSLGSYIAALGESSLPRHRAAAATVAGRRGILATQGAQFLPRTVHGCA